MDWTPVPEQSRPIVLLTDFGLQDPYVGEMRGVIASIAPRALVLDHGHGIRPGAVREGAWVLARGLETFPPGAVHVAVVDPGVGGERRGLVASAGGRLFVGPDNGLLAPALEAAASAAGGEIEVRELTLREIDRRRRGSTFDGRDVFAPAAARMAMGVPLGECGPEVADWETLPSFRPVAREGGHETEIIRVDRFGNLITTAEEAFLRTELGEDWRRLRVRAGNVVIEGIWLSYADVEPGEALLTIGGSGTLEVCVSSGNARRKLALGAGDRILVLPPAE